MVPRNVLAILLCFSRLIFLHAFLLARWSHAVSNAYIRISQHIYTTLLGLGVNYPHRSVSPDHAYGTSPSRCLRIHHIIVIDKAIFDLKARGPTL